MAPVIVFNVLEHRYTLSTPNTMDICVFFHICPDLDGNNTRNGSMGQLHSYVLLQIQK